MQGRIITFYSYKGGTGRSMLLANVAWLLAANGKRVLVLDWDLEAPGLHRYFAPFLADPELADSEGVIELITSCATSALAAAAPAAAKTSTDTGPATSPPSTAAPAAAQDILNYATSLEYEGFPGQGTVDFIPAGRQNAAYATRVNSFNWQAFYDRLGGGAFIESLRTQMHAKYDYVLIDSRTGVSDTAGICTLQLPDDLVVCFTLNNQSIEGASAVAASVIFQRNNPAAPGSDTGAPHTPRKGPVSVFPVMMRVDLYEKEKADARRELARNRFGRLGDSAATQKRQHESRPFIPSTDDEEFWGETQVQYVPYYSYEEVLATFADRRDDFHSVLAAVCRIARRITRDRTLEPPLIDQQTRRQVMTAFAKGQTADVTAARTIPWLERVRDRIARVARRPRVVGTLAVIVILALGAALAISRYQQGGFERKQRETYSRAVATIALTQIDRDYDLALLLATEAANTADTERAREALLACLARPVPLAVLSGHKSPVNTVAFSDSPPHRFMVTTEADRLAILWNLETLRPVQTFAHDRALLHAAVSPDGARIATATRDNISLWAADDNTLPYGKIQIAAGPVVQVVLTNEVLLAATPARVKVFDGRKAAFLREWHIERTGNTEAPVCRMAGEEDQGISAEANTAYPQVHQSGTTLAIVSNRSAALIRLGKEKDEVVGKLHDQVQVFSVGIPPLAGVHTLSGEYAQLWDLSKPKAVVQFPATLWHFAALSPDSRHAVTWLGSNPRLNPLDFMNTWQVRTWRASPKEGMTSLPVDILTDGRSGVAVDAQCQLLATCGESTTPGKGILQICKLPEGTRTRPSMEWSTVLQKLCFTPSGDRIVTADSRGTLQIWATTAADTISSGSTSDLLQAAQRRARRNELSAEERLRYLPPRPQP